MINILSKDKIKNKKKQEKKKQKKKKKKHADKDSRQNLYIFQGIDLLRTSIFFK